MPSRFLLSLTRMCTFINDWSIIKHTLTCSACLLHTSACRRVVHVPFQTKSIAKIVMITPSVCMTSIRSCTDVYVSLALLATAKHVRCLVVSHRTRQQETQKTSVELLVKREFAFINM